MAQTFKDAKGQQWTIHLTLRKALNAKVALGLDIYNFLDFQQLISSQLDRLAYLFVVLRDQIEEKGLNEDSFEELLYGRGIADQAGIAMVKEARDFFRRLGDQAMHQIAKKAAEAMEVDIENAQKMADSGELVRAMDKIIESQKQKTKQTDDGERSTSYLQ